MDIFQELHHICIVVRDIDKAVRYYESVGIGRWHDYPPLSDYTTLEGYDLDGFKQLTYKWASIRNMQFQLCQPGEGDTPQRHFLETRGEGVYHLGFVVPDCDTAEAKGLAGGLEIKAKGRRVDRTGFTYFETPDAAVTLEIRASPKAK